MTARLANWWCIVQIEIRKRKENAEISQTQPQCRFTTYLYSITWQCMSLGINCGLILQLMFSPGGGCSLAWEGLKWLSWELIVDFKSWHYSLKWEARQLYTWNNALTRVYHNQHCQNIQIRFFKKKWHNTPLQFYVMRKIVSKKPWFQSRSLACFLQGRKRSALREFFFLLRFVDNLGIKENGLYSTWGGGCPSMLMYAWYVFKSCPAPGGRVGRILLAFVPGIWIIGGEEEASGGDGDGGGLVRSGVTIGEGRSDL